MLTDLDRTYRDIQARAEARKRSARGWNAHIRAAAVDIEKLPGGVEYWIAENIISADIRRMREAEAAGTLPKGLLRSMELLRSFEGTYNGYVAFPKRSAPLLTRDMGGILAYIPVHGGVTWAHKDETAMVYGFDTQHYNSGHYPAREISWVKWQCRVLHEGILRAAKIEKAYLAARTEDAKAEILQPLCDMVPEEDISIMALMNVLMGKL